MKITCPHCLAPIEAIPALGGEVRCPACGANFRGPQPDTLDEPQRTAGPAPEFPERSPGPCPAVPGYEVLGELGRGGMGVVYKARQLSLDRLVALKMILAGEHAGPEAVARFRREAESVARLQHPVVVQIHEIGDQGGRPFLSLEYVGGGALAEKLAGQPQPIAVAARLTERLARAMHFAHLQGVIHRDLKPANVLLTGPEAPSLNGEQVEEATTPWGEPKITDFGLAKRLGAEARQTQSGAIVGTPGYMAPEQARGKISEIGPAADVYSLGAILYELLTGRAPFQGHGALDTVVRLLEEEAAPATRLRPDCPRDLETICHKCLRKSPDQRYASAGELADDLRRFLRGEPIRARPRSRLERGLHWLKRQRVAVLAVALALSALALVAWLPPWREPPPAGTIVEVQPVKGPAPIKKEKAPKGNAPAPREVPPLRKARPLPADLALVPRTALGFLCVRLGDFEKATREQKLAPVFRPLLGPEALAALAFYDERVGVALTDIERETWVVLKPRSVTAFADFEKLLAMGKSELTIYQTVRPYDQARVLRSLGPRRQTKQHEGKTYHTSNDTEFRAVYFAGERILVEGHPDAVRALLERLPLPTSPGPLRDALQVAAEGHLVVVGLNPPPGALAEWGDQLSASRPKLRPHVDALAEARALALSIDLVPGPVSKKRQAPAARLRLHFLFADELAAAASQPGAQAGLALAEKEMGPFVTDLREALSAPAWLLRMLGAPPQAVKAMYETMAPLHLALPKAKVERKGPAVRAELLVASAPRLLGGAVGLARFGGADDCKTNLARIGQALLAYEKKHGRLPPAAIYAADGRPLLSWRVLLLPYLGEEKLFKRFKLDQPWDSEHNKELLDQIPTAYAAGLLLSTVSHGTLFQALVGPDTLFEGKVGTKTEGAPARTILLAEGRKPVPWTKPEDLAYKSGGPLPELGGAFPDGFYLLSLGGGVRFAARSTSEKELRELFTRGSEKKLPR